VTERAGSEALKRGMQAAPLAILAPSSLPLVAKTVVGGAAIKTASKAGKKVAQKVETAARIASNPDRQKRFLDIMHQEQGSKLAGIASKLGGTQVGDVLFNATVDGTQAGILNSVEANLAQRDARQIGEAFGAAAGFAGPLSGISGERGAGASTQLVDAGGNITSRSQGSFNLAADQINARKTEALNQFDQSNKLQNLPDTVKAALGEAQEMGALPDDIIMLDSKDFNSAVNALKNAPNVSGEFNNAALFFPDDNVIFLNADADMAGREGLRIMGEELGHVFMREAIANDPSIAYREASRFSDDQGRAMPLSQGSGRDVKINKEMQGFVDAYNQEADASGAPRIENFDQAIMEYYGAQAGIDMASNQSVFSPSMPVWAQKIVHFSRQKALNMMGKQPRNTPEYASAIDRAADTPTGRYIREQYKIWQQESKSLNKALDSTMGKVVSPSDIKTPEQAHSALESDPATRGQPQQAPKVTKQKKLREGDLLKAAKAAGMPIERGSAVIRGAIPESVKQVWVEQFPKSQQAAARQWIDRIEQDALNRQSSVYIYTTTTGKNAGKTNRRHAVPEAGFRINKNNQMFVNMRDMDAINGNIQVAINEGRVGDKTSDQIQAEVLADLDQFEQNPDHQVSDQTRAIMGEKRKKDGKQLEGAWQGWDVPNNSDRRPIKDFDVDGLLAYGEAEGNGLFGQPRGQEGLVLANPRKVVIEEIE
jgi:hypothetical protein